jgi:hypothetical protein
MSRVSTPIEVLFLPCVHCGVTAAIGADNYHVGELPECFPCWRLYRPLTWPEYWQDMRARYLGPSMQHD